MQRRLFILFVLFSILPAAVILTVNWQISQRNLDYLDSPGLRQSMDGSLELAQERLSRELVGAAREAGELANAVSPPENAWPQPDTGCGYIFLSADGTKKSAGEMQPEFFDAVLRHYPASRKEPARLTIDDNDWLAATIELPGGRFVYVRSLDDVLARQLDAVVQGSNRFRQLRFYYGDLLRTNTIVTLLMFAVAVLIIALLMSRRLASQIAGPVKALARGTEQVAEGDLDLHIDVKTKDELGDLVNAFNRMTGDLKRSKEDLVRAERVAAWQGIARRLAHEIKNPLTPIALAMHRIEKRASDPATTDSVATVLEEVDNLKRLADEFSLYARLPEPAHEDADLSELIRSVTGLYADRQRVTVEWSGFNGEARWPVRVDTGQIRQVIANIVKNAIHAMAGKGTLTIQLTRTTGSIVAAFIDAGPGLPEPVNKVFEPYFTTRSTGTGLGLAIARKIVEDHGGELSAANVKEGGAKFCLTLPAAPKETT